MPQCRRRAAVLAIVPAIGEIPVARRKQGSMPIHIALVRAINVGGRNMVAMSDLRELLESLGFAGAKSLLQSGNLIFQGDQRTGAKLESLLELETEKRFHVAVDYFVRTAEEWETIIARNPLPNEAERDPSHLVVVFLKKAPEAKDVQALQAAISGPEMVRSDGKQLYVVYPAGIGTSKLTNTLIERKLGTRGTGRNWNTVLKLAALTQT
ncbi:MAG: DUF1697 domain-containing protein [Planctomycetota bacterium]|nr:MAG: DUF1697 domain-containing protein [Planctomycetota bacterium]